MKRAVVIGALIILVSSVWPVRAVNALCCLGVIVGGLAAGVLTGRAEGGMLESTRGLRAGAYAGVLASVAALLANGFASTAGLALPALDPIPDFIYQFAYGIWDGVRDLPRRGAGAEGGEPGFTWRLFFQVPSNAMFGAFGGVIAASLFRREPPIE